MGGGPIKSNKNVDLGPWGMSCVEGTLENKRRYKFLISVLTDTVIMYYVLLIETNSHKLNVVVSNLHFG